MKVKAANTTTTTAPPPDAGGAEAKAAPVAAAPPTERTTVDGIAAKLAETSVLDVAFALDCTASMGSYINAAQRSIASIAEQIVAAEHADVRFALVEYRDHPPQDSTFVTRVTPFTGSISRMKQQLDRCQASGGGDTPEAVADAMHDCLKLDWREDATKITVLVADAPPHGLGIGNDGFPDGSPTGCDPVEISHKMAAAGITLYTVGCEPAVNRWLEFFEGLAHITGGQYCGLNSASGLCDVIVGGAREEMALERMMAEAEAETDATGAGADEDQQAQALFAKLSAKKATATELRRGGAAYTPSPVAVKLKSAGRTLSSYSKAWRESTPERSAKTRKMMGGFYVGGRRGSASPLGSVTSMARRAMFGAVDDAADPGAAGDGYEAVASAISMAQCSRMISKSRARKGWS